jgi:hypothetical protein
MSFVFRRYSNGFLQNKWSTTRDRPNSKILYKVGPKIQPQENKVHCFQKRCEDKNNERGHNGGHQQEVVSEITYFGVKLESTRGWRRQEVRIKT